MSESTITLILLWVHVPFATAWIAVAVLDAFLAVAPGLSAAQRGSLIRLTLPVVLVALPIIVATGIWQTVYNPVTRPMWSWALLDELKRSTYGWALFYKHVFVIGTLLCTLVIKLVLVRRLAAPAVVAAGGQGGTALAAPSPDDRGDRALQTGAWVNVACCLAILICVVLMVYQLH